ncbi:MAG: hypothetical protein KAX49_05145 [Halanaerobiales bacterium]|nr:hypothetical protein [Halanaerobiales bacterium]
MGTDLEEKFICPLIAILLDKENIFEAKEIIEETLKVKKETPELIIAYGEVKKIFGEFEDALTMVDKAIQKYSYPHLILFKLETLMDIDDTLEAFKVWYQYYDDLKDMDGEPILEYLHIILEENFKISSNEDSKKIKATILNAINIYKLWEKSHINIIKENFDEAKDILKEISNLLPNNSKFCLNLLENYLEISEYQEFIEYANTIEVYHNDNPDFYQLYTNALIETNNLTIAKEYIDKAFELALKDEEFEKWGIIGDYLCILLEINNIDELQVFLEKVNKIVPKEESLINILQMSLRSYDIPTNFGRLLEKLKEIKDNSIIDIKEVYLNSIFLLVLKLDKEELVNNLDIEQIKQTIKTEIDNANKEISYNPIIEYACLRIGENNKEEIDKKLAKLIAFPTENHLVESIKYEAVLKYDKPEIILNNQLKANLPEKNLEFYKLVASIKTNKLEMVKELFRKVLLGNSPILKVMDNMFVLLKYIEKDQLFTVLKKIEVNEISEVETVFKKNIF